MMRFGIRIHWLAFMLAGPALLSAQNHRPESDSLGTGHFRGLYAVSTKVIWVSGSNGSVFRTANAGETWMQCSPAAFPTRDFRDIHAWSRRRAVAMSSGDSAVILATRNGGKSWTKVYENNIPGIFLDGMDFHGAKGACLGDPMPNSLERGKTAFLILLSDDRGMSWKEIWTSGNGILQSGEAAFAASGTSIAYRKDTKHDTVVWVSGGGMHPRLFRSTRMGNDVLMSDSNQIVQLPLKGGEGWGAYTLTLTGNYGVILGGHYKFFRQGDSTAAWLNPATGRFELSDSFPKGYRSGSCYDPKTGYFYCTGTNGTNISRNHGRTWEPFSAVGGNAVVVSDSMLVVAGNRGKMYRFRLR
ncbi:MAG: WD40/YVTN/BNR-like repeat-containing protein [Bacteroidia bacterium]